MAPLCWVQPPLLPCCRVASPGRDAVLTPLLTTSRACGLLCHITSDAPGTFNISASPGVYGCGCGCRHLCHVSHLLSSNCQRLTHHGTIHDQPCNTLSTMITMIPEHIGPSRSLSLSLFPIMQRTLCNLGKTHAMTIHQTQTPHVGSGSAKSSQCMGSSSW